MAPSCRFAVLQTLLKNLSIAIIAVFCFGMITPLAAQTTTVRRSPQSNLDSGNRAVPTAPHANTAGTASNAIASGTPAPARMRGTTMAQRRAAAASAAVRRSTAPRTPALPKLRSNAIVGTPGNPAGPATLDQLYFSGIYPNYANSPLPNVNDPACIAPNYCGIRKFVDTLPLLNQANDLLNMLPIAVADTTTYPGSDYYEISLVEYHQQMHKDLPATQLRGYVQTNFGTDPISGNNTVAPAPVYYLGPIIVGQTNRPVRVKFTNALPTGTAGNLFIPTDLSALGAGLGMANGSSPYLQNRATVHLHGGNTPWISDGTPHQWTIPAGDWNNTAYQRGDSVQFVPDMYFVNGVVVPQCSLTVTANCSDPTGAKLPAGATNDPGPGSLTFYYTNQQSARLLFYHDHAYGTTRLNVYAGEASAFLITDQVDQDLMNGTDVSGVFAKAGVLTPGAAVPSAQIPLVIQDKTFVPQNPLSTTVSSISMLANGSGYTAATVSFGTGCATPPVATATVGYMTDPFGMLISGAVTGITMASAGTGCTSAPAVTITGDGLGAAAFASLATLSQEDPTWDTALWGGYGNLWYPHVYMTNQWPGNPDGSSTNPMGRWDYASWFWPPFNGTGLYTARGELPCPTAYDATMTCPGVPSVLAPAPAVEADGVTPHLGAGSTVSVTPEGFMDTPLVNGVPYPTLTVDAKPYRFRILSVANERAFNLSWFLACDSKGGSNGYTPTVGAVCPADTVNGTNLTEVGMVPAVTTAGFPVWWPTDGRSGGVPDPAAMGPNWIQIGTEGGVLPAIANIPPSPVSYESSTRSVTVLNVQNHGLLLMSAERADAIVDFTPFAGRTLILYNDSPAPMPAHDDRNDYYTGDADNTGTGGAPTTLAGFGPNTRTLMQVVVTSTVVAPPPNMANLSKLIPAAFNLTQPVPVVPEPQYSSAYGQTFPSNYPALQSTSLTFTPIDPATKLLSTTVTNTPVAGGTGVTLPLRYKTIQELFELDYGRMNATLGTELPLTNFNTQTTIPLGYIDPFSEDIYDSANVQATPVGFGADGSQIWFVIHNGVDSHAIHFHLYDVQLINRFGWDGTNRAPFPDELGWKDTVRMNPLELAFVALRPMSQTLPFPVPDSARLFDVTRPAGADLAMSAFDPLNGAAPQINQVQPMGWEYVWHCHLLGHEENDMMREQIFQVPPQTPVNVTSVATSSGNVLTFTDMSLSEAGFNVRRATDALMTLNVTNFSAVVPSVAGWNKPGTWTDTSAVRGTTYYYQVQSYKPDASYWTPLIGPLAGPGQGNPTTLPNLVSAWSIAAQVQAIAVIQVTPRTLTYAARLDLTTSPAQSITVRSIGLANVVIGAISISGTNPTDFAFTTTCPVTPTAMTFNGSCLINVTFKPTAPGVRTANLVITSNDPVNPSITIVLTGTGIAPPTLTSIVPASASRATTAKSVPVVLTGTNLTGATAVTTTGTGVIVSSFTVVSATTINATLVIASTAALGTRNIQVVTPVATSNPLGFTTLAGPSLTAVAPNSGAAGSTVPITLTGTDLALATSVTVSGTGVTCTITGTSTATSMTASCVIASTATGGGRTITVATPDGNTNTVTFTVLVPTLTSIAPASATLATTTKNVPVVLTGTNLTGATAVTITGTGVTVASFTVASATTINATLALAPTATLGTRNVQVVTPSGTTGSVGFTTLAGPSLASISPASGAVGTTVPVTFAGTDLAAASAVTVSGTGVTCTITGTPTATSLNASCAILAAAAAGVRTVSITTPDGATNTVNFTVLAPSLTSISPASATLATTTKSVPVVLTGTLLTGATAVTVSGTGVTVSSFTVASATTINATLSMAPTAAVGARNVAVVTPSGTTGAVSFAVLAGPSLTSVTPATGLVGTTVSVTITGTDLASASAVTVTGTGVTCALTGTPTVTSMTASCPVALTAAPGVRSLTVTTPDGVTNAVNFTVLGPTLTLIAPASATLATTTKSVLVVLTGTNLTGATAVTVSGTGVTVTTFTVASATTINVTLSMASTAAQGTRNVAVVTPSGTTAAVGFTVLAGPSLTSIVPATGALGATIPVTFTGTDLANASAITVSGVGVTCTRTGIPTATTLTANCAIATTAATGARTVSVTTPDGPTNTVTFTVQGPTLASIAPASATLATTTKSVPVVLTGANLTGATAVTVAGTGVTVSSFTVVNATTINATLSMAPTATLGTRNVTVVTPIGTTNVVGFATLAGPSLSAISPGTGSLGTTVPVTFTGTDLASGSAITVSGTGVTCTRTGTPTTTVLTANCAITTTALTGARTVSITTLDGPTNTMTFTVQGATLTSIAPASATLATTTKSVPVVLTGTLLTGATAVTVTGTGVTVSSFTVVNATTVNATLSMATTTVVGTRNVQVVTPLGTTNAVGFTTLAGPSLASITPATGLLGTTVPVTLTGTDLAAASAIAVSGTGVTCTTTGTPTTTTLTANCVITTTALTGARTVSVTTPDGATNTVTFTIQGPTLTSITPASASRGTTTTNIPVVLSGNGLTGATAVIVAGTGVTVSTFTVVNATTVNATLSVAPTATAGTRNVQVVTPIGTTNAVGFTTLLGSVAFSGPTPALTTATPDTTTKTGTITVSNTATGTSAGPINLTAASSIAKVGTTGGTFSLIAGGTCVSGFVIQPGGSCTIVVQYLPGTSTATATANVTITNTGAATATQTTPNFTAN